MNLNVITSVFRKEIAGYFANPTGYVFITLFVFLSGVAAFWVEAFFVRNLANLDTLNTYFPLLLLFLIPAITMASWAEERKQGTDELLLTLPAKVGDLMVGKFLGCAAIYTVCLLFASSHVLVLIYLGRPDVGLMVSTYLGYWLAGVALCGVGLFASVLSASPVISFIACALACGLMVAIGLVGDILPAGAGAAGLPLTDALRAVSIPQRLESFGRGVIEPADVLYFAAVAAVGVWAASKVVAARRTAHPAAMTSLHLPLRLAALATLAVCGVLLVERLAMRVDATAERLWSVSAPTRELIGKIQPDRPVVVEAFVSGRVPAQLVQQRETLVGLLKEIESLGQGRVQVQINPTEPNTEGARNADRSYGIRPRAVLSEERGGGAVQEVFLGVAVSGGGGAEPSVIPFLSPGLPVEYELARAIRSAGADTRKTIGVLDTDAALFGRFDFQTMQPGRDWPIIAELRKQYKVERVAPATEVPANIDVLLVAQPSSLTPEELTRVTDYVKAGRPAIILEDPLPIANPSIASTEPRRPANPMMGGDPRSQQPKADLAPLFDLLGARVVTDAVVWDTYNPHPLLRETPNEFIWLAQSAPWASVTPPFNEQQPISSGLQEVVLLFTGRIEQTAAKPEATGAGTTVAARPEVIPLLRSGPASGQMPYANIMQRSFFGMQFNPNRRPVRTAQSQTVGALIRGTGEQKLNVVLLSDLDFVSETFFQLREQGSGGAGLEFDNVTFILNAVDALAGETALMDLRKKRRMHRTLERLEQSRQQLLEASKDAESLAEDEASAQLAEAQSRLDAEVKKVQERTDMDDNAKAIQVETVRRAEQRRLDVQTRAIEDQKRQRIEDARLANQAAIERTQTQVRLLAVTLPPVPALLLGLAVTTRRRRMEAESARRERAN